MSGALNTRQITIVGAGVAGLACAAAMAQRGAQVLLLEQGDALRAVGAGLQLSPNAMRVIDALGIGAALRESALRNEAVLLRDSSGAAVARLDLIGHRPDGDYRLIHRARLIELLARAATDAGVRIEFGRKVTQVPDGPLVIGADGLRSTVRQALNGREVPFFTRQTAWRALIPDEGGGVGAQVFMGPGRHLVSYPLKGGLRNLVAVQERDEWQDEGWSHADDPARLREAFSGFGGPVPEWLGRVTETHIWGLFRHEIAPKWHDGRHALIGDALHPTLPFMAQGAAMALEDAWLMASCLDKHAESATALDRFEALRKTRVTRIVAEANRNARNYHFSGPMRLAAHTVLRLADRFAASKLLSRFDWIYDYDAVSVTV